MYRPCLFCFRCQQKEGSRGQPIEVGHQLHVPVGRHGPAGHVLLPHERGGGSQGKTQASEW